MFDFSFGELAVIGAVALVVLGPERLPKVARMAGEWAGKAQRYVSQVKTDITREIEVAELQKLRQQAMDVARSIETSVKDGVTGIQSDLKSTATALNSSLEGAAGGAGGSGTGADGDAWGESGDTWGSRRFHRRYRPGPSIDELTEEIAKLKRQLAMPEAPGHSRHKYAPRSRMNRPRIRR
jgi:sec-independent protein translocase protein TatB